MEKNNTVLENKVIGKEESQEENKLISSQSTLIKEFIIDNFLFGDSENFKDDTDLFRESIVDSTGILELISYLEVTFKIRVQDEDIVQENFNSINAINGFVVKKLKESD